MRKLSSYQKLKQENERLRENIKELDTDIISLIKEPRSIRSTQIKLRIALRGNIEAAIWHGEARNWSSLPQGFFKLRN